MKTVIVWIAVIMFMTIAGCDKASVTLKPLAFNNSTTMLADLPEGSQAADIAFSPDGHYVAAIVKQNGKEYMSINAGAGTPYESVRQPVFRKGLAGYAFIARKAGKECVVVDEQEGQWYDAVAKLSFAPDGHIIYAGKRGDKWMIVSGTRESAVFDEVSISPLVIGDGKRLVYVEQHTGAKKSFVRVCDLELRSCTRGKEYDSIGALRYDKNRSRLAYVAKSSGKSKIVVLDLTRPGLEEKDGALYDEIPVFNISDNGVHIAFLGRRGEGAVLVKDGAEQPSAQYDVAFDMVVADTGRTMHTAMVNGRVSAFVDGQRMGREYNSINFPIFSADGSNAVFVAERAEKGFVVVNGAEGPAFDKVVSPHFSPAGSRLVYRARQKDERFVVVADAEGRTVKEHPHYEAVWDVSFSPDGKLVGYGVKTGQEFWWKVEKL